MSFWEKILHRRIYQDIARHVIDKDKRYADRNKYDNLYQKGFSIILCLAGIGLIIGTATQAKESDQVIYSFAEIGFFVIGSGLYGLAPEPKLKKSRSVPDSWKKSCPFWMTACSFFLIFVIIVVNLWLLDKKEEIAQLSWIILGIMTMCFINAFKQLINNWTD